MKSVKTLLLICAVLISTANFAQTSRLNGKEFKVVVSKSQQTDQDAQTFDILKFNNNKLNSAENAKTGVKQSAFTEKTGERVTDFTATLGNATQGTWVYDGHMEDNHMWGTILVTRPGQSPVTYEFRGMTTQLWDASEKRRESGE